jgi:hypothetical protein
MLANSGFAFLFRLFALDRKLDFLPRVTAEHLPMTAERVHISTARGGCADQLTTRHSGPGFTTTG